MYTNNVNKSKADLFSSYNIILLKSCLLTPVTYRQVLKMRRFNVFLFWMKAHLTIFLRKGVRVYIIPPMPPIPPIPPIPPMPPAGMAGASSFISVTTASAVVKSEATPLASVKALLTT